jgi:hypothetical protein
LARCPMPTTRLYCRCLHCCVCCWCCNGLLVHHSSTLHRADDKQWWVEPWFSACMSSGPSSLCRGLL